MAMKFRVNRGSHVVQEWVPATEEEINIGIMGMVQRRDKKWYKLVKRTYEAGDVVETPTDLTRFNSPGSLGPKFTPIEKEVPRIPNPWDNLDNMTIEQLRAFATSQEIDLGSAKKKEEILVLLQEVVSEKSEEVSV